MFKRLALWMICLVIASPAAFADSDYIYRQRLNWVKVKKASPKEVPLGTFKHPAQITPEAMEAMLLSIKINNKFLLKKEIETNEVFNSWEARKYAPLLAQALAQADNDQVVNFSVVHKRPMFILRNDHLSMGNVWVSEEGVHVQFNKLYAKLDGDYEATGNMDKAVRRAKSVRVTLAANEGQKLSYNSPTEIILSPSHDFESQVQMAKAEELRQEEEKLKSKKDRKTAKKSNDPVTAKPEPQLSAPPPVSKPASAAVSGDTAERLKKLDELKADKLITQEEYNQLRKKILSEI